MTFREFVPWRSGPLLRVGKEKARVLGGLRDGARVDREKQSGWKQLRPPKKSADPQPPRSCPSPQCGHKDKPMTNSHLSRQPPATSHYQRGQQATISTEHFEMKADFQCPGCDTGTRFDFLFRTSAPRPEFGCLPIFKINLAMFEVRRPSSARIHWEFGVRGRRPIRLILAIFQSSVGQCKSFLI